jgi:hypothetical protein
MGTALKTITVLSMGLAFAWGWRLPLALFMPTKRLLCDGDVGQPFAQGVREILGEHVTARLQQTCFGDIKEMRYPPHAQALAGCLPTQLPPRLIPDT